jgi:hypothetical protein
MGPGRLSLCVALLAAVIVGCGGEAPPPATPENAPASADDAQEDVSGDVTTEDFEEPLSNYGTWLDDPTYGRVWQPADDVSGADFAPYGSDGAWVANEDGDGWVYESKYNDDYGWATYHYGRWVEHDEYGWVWQPGVEWAPSWVEWRYGGGYVGYVPYGPEGYVYPENRWAFVEERHFGDAGGVWGIRLAPERIHAVFVAAPLIEVRAGGHWSAGPSRDRIRAAGGTVRTAKVSPMNRAGVRAAGKAAVARAASAGRPKPSTSGQASAAIRRGPNKGTVKQVASRAPVAAARAGRTAAGAAAGHNAGAAPAHNEQGRPAREPAREPTREPARTAEPARTTEPAKAAAHPVAPVATNKPKPAAPPPAKKAPPKKRK